MTVPDNPDHRDGESATVMRANADRYAARVLQLVAVGHSYRDISHRLGLSKNTVGHIVKRDREAPVA